MMVTWRPGSNGGAPALGLGPGKEDGSVLIRAKAPLQAMGDQSVPLDCLDDEFVKRAR